MASTGSGGSLPPNFLLTPQQQSLLFAALNSNRQSPGANANPPTASPAVFTNPAASNGPANGFGDSTFLDNLDNLDYADFGDSSFDFSFANGDQSAIGDDTNVVKSESPENDVHEKRSHPDDEEDASPEHGSKRRESTEKVPKKPGRKPLTSEPSSKRKAQNRAAQRAFRERKEQHLKDLETKVEELQKASDDANNENTSLRAKLEQITNELNQYKKKVSLMSQNSPQAQNKFSSVGKYTGNGFSDLDFQFDFPTFGVPTPPTDKSQRSVSQPISPQSNTPSLGMAANKNGGYKSSSQDTAFNNAQFNEDLAKFSNGFTPSMSSSVTNASRASLDSASFSQGGATSSPSASSQSNAGPSSSCGTSPEPLTQSPMGFKPVETLTTIGEEQPTMSTSNQPFTQFSNMNFDNTNFDWLAQQNGGQFDPQLFGDYREPQNNILTNPAFDDFFNDAVDNDFFTPFNMAPSPMNGGKKNLIDEIDAQKNTVHEEPAKTNMSCNQIWYATPEQHLQDRIANNLNREKLQSCPNAQSGEFDLDALCSDLTKKAKCSGNGPVVGEADFNTILKKYMGGKDASCVAQKLGIEVEKAT